MWPTTLEGLNLSPLVVAIFVLALGGFIAAKLVSSASDTSPETQQKQEKRTFTASEVAQHTKKDSLWIILKDKVYDVTPYVEEHPGGEAIFRNAGQDSTKGFYGPQHPERVFDLIDDFYIGDLVE